MTASMDKDCVILLHGLTRSPLSMRKLEGFLEGKGYDVVNQGYDSRESVIEDLAITTIDEALYECRTAKKVHFVTHSLGGILLRQYLATKPIAPLGRTVMLAPPNQGSEVPDKFAHIPGFSFINGPAGAQLGTGENSLPIALGPADFDLGIIAGNKTINLILSALIPEVDDGKVAIESTKLEGMNDHIIMPVSHPMIMRDDDVLEQVVHYLQKGRFSRPAT
jgi:pimeloyl-ACP methyl ester carboxylesterase